MAHLMEKNWRLQHFLDSTSSSQPIRCYVMFWSQGLQNTSPMALDYTCAGMMQTPYSMIAIRGEHFHISAHCNQKANKEAKFDKIRNTCKKLQ